MSEDMKTNKTAKRAIGIYVELNRYFLEWFKTEYGDCKEYHEIAIKIDKKVKYFSLDELKKLLGFKGENEPKNTK